MYTRVDKPKENKCRTAVNSVIQKINNRQPSNFKDNRLDPQVNLMKKRKLISNDRKTIIQMARYARVLGGMEIDLQEIDDQGLYKIYRNYYLPNRRNKNYEEFGRKIREELEERNLSIPTIDTETKWVRTSKNKVKFGVLMDYYYRPVIKHTEAGNTHYLSDQPAVENVRAQHVKLTELGVKLMYQALYKINHSESKFLHSDESYTNVYVSVDGVEWGLHLSEAEGGKIFPIANQNLPEYFDS